MQFIEGTPRHQAYFSTLDDQLTGDNPVRLIDAFIDKIDLQKPVFINTVHKSEGRPPCAPVVLLKLYLYGYLNKIGSSRKLQRECWMPVIFKIKKEAGSARREAYRL